MFRQAVRALAKSRGYAAACVAVLALGIGANVAIFSLMFDAILKPLPYPDADRLVLIYGGFPSLPAPMTNHMPVSRIAYEEWRRQATAFVGVEAFHEASFRETGDERPRVLATELVSAGFLPLLGVKPQVGRLFRAEEETPGADAVVILSDRYYEQRFSRDPSALGTALTFGGATYTVIGVMPRDFYLPATLGGEHQGRPDVYIPLSRTWTRPEVDRQSILSVAARLRPEIPLAQARAEMKLLGARLHQSDLERFPFADAHVFSFAEEHRSADLDRALFVLLGAVGLVLLTGCANLANLTLARASRRSREIAIRLALGASRGDIVRQLLIESLLLSAAGAAAGLLLARWAISGLLVLAPQDSMRPGMGQLSLPVYLFAVAIAAVTVVLFGLAPAVAASATELNTALKSGDRAASHGSDRSRKYLIGAEVAMALILISGAGLLLRSFAKVVATELGFNVEHLLVVDIDLPEAEYPDRGVRSRLFEDILEKAKGLPGVTAATMSNSLPLHRVSMTSFDVVGQPPRPPGEVVTADYANVLPGYLNILGVPVVAGRDLTIEDVVREREVGEDASKNGTEGAALVNRAFAEKFLPGVDPLQQRLVVNDRRIAIVGITANFRALGAEEEIRPQFFRPGLESEAGVLLLKSGLSVDALSAQVRTLLGSIDEKLSTAPIQTLDDFVDEWLEYRWFGLVLLSIFAGVALALAMLGVHSVLANLVSARTREIRIRMTLGATRSGIIRLVVGQSAPPILCGLAVGLAGSLALGVVIRSMLFQVPPYDPVTFTLAAAAILAVTPLALWWPIRRATRVACTVALREE